MCVWGGKTPTTSSPRSADILSTTFIRETFQLIELTLTCSKLEHISTFYLAELRIY